jgi:hypothetical protein
MPIDEQTLPNDILYPPTSVGETPENHPKCRLSSPFFFKKKKYKNIKRLVLGSQRQEIVLQYLQLDLTEKSKSVGVANLQEGPGSFERYVWMIPEEMLALLK